VFIGNPGRAATKNFLRNSLFCNILPVNPYYAWICRASRRYPLTNYNQINVLPGSHKKSVVIPLPLERRQRRRQSITLMRWFLIRVHPRESVAKKCLRGS
jgi:hypothetical protein